MLTSEEVQARLSKCVAPRVTLEGMVSKIHEARYLRDGQTTICVLELKNGFKLIGHSTPASPENFDSAVGEHYAYENALRQMWPLEGYLLRERLSTNQG